ncbi:MULTISPECIES: hypothetical protein [unclassified Flavonifractor]|nr:MULTISPECIES: hypothetical protein [unclassified Flavonifractor]
MESAVETLVPLKRELMLQANQRLYEQKTIPRDLYEATQQLILAWKST